MNDTPKEAEKSLVEQARSKLEAAVQRRDNQEYIAQLTEYLEKGTMPYSFWVKLPRSTQKHYQNRWRGMPNHINGRPMKIEERKRKAAQRNKVRAKKKAARKARATMYRRRK